MTSLLDEAVRSGYFWKKTRPKSMEHTPTLKKNHIPERYRPTSLLYSTRNEPLLKNKVIVRNRVSAAGLFVILSCPPSMVSPVLCPRSEANTLSFVIQSEETMNGGNFSN